MHHGSRHSSGSGRKDNCHIREELHYSKDDGIKVLGAPCRHRIWEQLAQRCPKACVRDVLSVSSSDLDDILQRRFVHLMSWSIVKVGLFGNRGATTMPAARQCAVSSPPLVSPSICNLAAEREIKFLCVYVPMCLAGLLRSCLCQSLRHAYPKPQQANTRLPNRWLVSCRLRGLFISVFRVIS